MSYPPVTSWTNEALIELRLLLIKNDLFNVDVILGVPVKTSKEFAAWCAAMRSGEVYKVRVQVDLIEEEMRKRGMRKPAKPKMPRLRPRSLVTDGVAVPVYGSARQVLAVESDIRS